VPPPGVVGTFLMSCRTAAAHGRRPTLSVESETPVARTVDEDELIEYWTLVGEELELLAGKRGPTRLAFALLLKFHQSARPLPPRPHRPER
jgi:hypothetical protein